MLYKILWLWIKYNQLCTNKGFEKLMKKYKLQIDEQESHMLKLPDKGYRIILLQFKNFKTIKFVRELETKA